MRLINFLKFSFLSLILISSFFISKNVLASTLELESCYEDTNIGYNIYSGETFQAQSSNKIVGLTISHGSANGITNIKFKICEVSNYNSNPDNCLDTPQLSTNSNSTTDIDFTYTFNYTMTSGHYYIFFPYFTGDYFFAKAHQHDCSTTGIGKQTDSRSGGSSSTYWDYYFKLYTELAKIPLAITAQYYDSEKRTLELTGSCSTYGSGINQLSFYADSYPDTNNPGNVFNNLPDCVGDVWAANYTSLDMAGVHNFFIDDTFFGTEIASTSQDFSTTTKEWEFSWGYMSSDSPESTAERLSCTDAEWASTDWWDKLRCRVVKTYWIAYFGARDQARDIMGSSQVVIKNMFPYSVGTKINDCWTQSASSTLPSKLSWINGADGSGNIKISIFGSSASTTIWGPAIFANTTSTAAAYTGVKDFTTYLYWGLFFAWLIYMGVQVKNHLHN